MKRAKYILLLLVVIILILIGIITLIPKAKNRVDKISPVNNLKQNDSLATNKGNKASITYEIINLKAITSDYNYASPSFSPDGKKIAVTNLNCRGITIENMDDNTLKSITDDEGAGFRFSWSTDSKSITYLSRKNINGVAVNIIKVVEIDNGKIFELTSPGIGASMPTFTQSNEVIYSFKGSLIKRKWNIGNVGNEEIITENVPANIIIPSPKNDKLVIEDDEGIKIMDSNGDNRKTIIQNGGKEFAGNARISFDCSKVLFFNNIGSIEHMFVYDIGKEKTTDLGEGHFGKWLPDGRIIYSISLDDGFVITQSDLYIINSDGTRKIKITDTPNVIESQPNISKDGKIITYRDEKSGKIFYGKLKNLNR